VPPHPSCRLHYYLNHLIANNPLAATLPLLSPSCLHPWPCMRWWCYRVQRQSKAVWRGEGFELDLKITNWASSFRLRLHRMSDAAPRPPGRARHHVGAQGQGTPRTPSSGGP